MSAVPIVPAGSFGSTFNDIATTKFMYVLSSTPPCMQKEYVRSIARFREKKIVFFVYVWGSASPACLHYRQSHIIIVQTGWYIFFDGFAVNRLKMRGGLSCRRNVSVVPLSLCRCTSGCSISPPRRNPAQKITYILLGSSTDLEMSRTLSPYETRLSP